MTTCRAWLGLQLQTFSGAAAPEEEASAAFQTRRGAKPQQAHPGYMPCFVGHTSIIAEISGQTRLRSLARVSSCGWGRLGAARSPERESRSEARASGPGSVWTRTCATGAGGKLCLRVPERLGDLNICILGRLCRPSWPIFAQLRARSAPFDPNSERPPLQTSGRSPATPPHRPPPQRELTPRSLPRPSPRQACTVHLRGPRPSHRLVSVSVRACAGVSAS